MKKPIKQTKTKDSIEERILRKCPKGFQYYAVQLLHQARVVIQGENNKMRSCSIAIRLLRAKTDKDALKLAKKAGKTSEVSYPNSDGNMVHNEFVGIAGMMKLDSTLLPFDEVWVWTGDMLNPMERKDILTLSDKEIMERL